MEQRRSRWLALSLPGRRTDSSLPTGRRLVIALAGVLSPTPGDVDDRCTNGVPTSSEVRRQNAPWADESGALGARARSMTRRMHRYPATTPCRGRMPMTTATLSTVARPPTPAPSEWAVETHGLTKRFGPNIAVNGVELLVPRGCAFGYLGPNGAGKTTLIRVLLGLTHADAGIDVAARLRRPPPSGRGLGPGGGHRRRTPLPRPSDRATEPPDPGGGARAGGPRPHRAVARARGHPPSGRRQGVEVLHGYAPAPGGGRLPASAIPNC